MINKFIRQNNMKTFEQEIKQGQRFEFGKNWQSFLSSLTDERIKIAENSIKEMLQVAHLKGKRVLDIGSGSGLFSLAARNLGAKVHSFDYDPASVACTKMLRSRYFPGDPNWIVEKGSVLDGDFLSSVGSFDLIYSWGVLHHTGNMWAAIENAASLAKKNNTLFIAIYNNQDGRSRLWTKIKKFYCSGLLGRAITSTIFIPYFFSKTLISSVIRSRNEFAAYKKNRGMSIMHDWFDWLGGYPFEVATVEEIFNFLHPKGFELKNIRNTNHSGTNQFVFVKESD
ncbi:class I SAM-dependent methyltransferase [Pedobacter heparinus]|uniref:class I SAM-dependent methyltransferase n=1 Tax=Pedobacter heparinus TaxID=984 RepID=UPI00292E35CC|nr:class I SAM-dependent methyltransferase [Pedobacter heparinus]